ELSWKRGRKFYPKIGEKTAADMSGRISQDRDPLDAFLNVGPALSRSAPAGEPALRRGAIEKSLDSLRSVLRPLSTESMKRNPSECIRLVVDKGYADYARSKFRTAQARLDNLQQLSSYP